MPTVTLQREQTSDSTLEQVGASATAIRHHYDTGNEFFALWLDRTMNYSSALWEATDTLETAQYRKMDYHAYEARAAGADSVLDIGCGWGGMMRHLVERHGTKQVTGLTLSQAQAEFIANQRLDRITVRVEGWEQHNPDQPYDAIISIGAIEHFARLDMSASERVQNYRAFFQRCRDFLKPGCWMSLQTFAYGAYHSREINRHSAGTQFLAEHIFRETDPPCLIELVEAWDSQFELVRLRNDRLHYAKTCRVWLENLRASKQAAVEYIGEDSFSHYERYLKLSTVGFQTGKLDLYRITLRKK
jgi:cyclopropane-fatty-acyl-phospholipid synthase